MAMHFSPRHDGAYISRVRHYQYSNFGLLRVSAHTVRISDRDGVAEMFRERGTTDKYECLRPSRRAQLDIDEVAACRRTSTMPLHYLASPRDHDVSRMRYYRKRLRANVTAAIPMLLSLLPVVLRRAEPRFLAAGYPRHPRFHERQ